jgi:hypothetical protein
MIRSNGSAERWKSARLGYHPDVERKNAKGCALFQHRAPVVEGEPEPKSVTLLQLRHLEETDRGDTQHASRARRTPHEATSRAPEAVLGARGDGDERGRVEYGA